MHLLKRVMKCLTSLMLPGAMTISFITSCGPKPIVAPELIITDPQEKSSFAVLNDDGTASIFFNSFSFNELADQTKLTVSGSFSHQTMTFQYSIINFDAINRVFSVQIDIQNGQPVEHLKGKLTFTYDGKTIVPEQQSEFDISLSNQPQINLPDVKTAENEIIDGNAWITFDGFTCSDILDSSLLFVFYSGQPTLGEIKSCSIINFLNNKFSVQIIFSGVAAETIDGTFTFQYASSQIDVPPDNFSCKLIRDRKMPDFQTDSWANVMCYASDGLQSLQQHYGVANFVGLTRVVDVKTNKVGESPKSYPVTVVGQNQDHYFESGAIVPLTFQFDNVISEYKDDEYVPVTEMWDLGDDCRPWYNTEDGTQCHLREYLNTEFYNKLDIDVREAIKPVSKTTLCNDPEIGDEPQFMESRDIIWCFSPSELGIAEGQAHGYEKEGECYQYYQSSYGLQESNLRLATELGHDENIQPWWCRSPFAYGNKNGGISTTYREVPIRPCFCI